jgi:putative (di)nucleoside polyphosphate hydrolase
MTEASKIYRACVGIVLINADKHVFVGERLDNPGAWQMPQGGIDDGEEIEAAFFREMEEEIGTASAEIIRGLDKPLRYDLPDHLQGKLWNGKYCGQEQHWIAAHFTGDDSQINIYAHHFPEFKQWQWIPISDILGLVVPFKRSTYEEVIKGFSDLF